MKLVTDRENYAVHNRLEQTHGEHGLKPRNALLCTEVGEARALVAKVMGVAIIPRSAAEEPGPLMDLRPTGAQPFTWFVALVWRAHRRQRATARALLALAIAWASAMPAMRLLA